MEQKNNKHIEKRDTNPIIKGEYNPNNNKNSTPSPPKFKPIKESGKNKND